MPARPRVAGPAHWRRYLADCPTWALEDTLCRRREEALQLAPIAVGEDLVVDPVAGLVRWRGVDYAVAGRQLAVLDALAVGWLDGRRRMRSVSLATAVWRGRPADEAVANLHATMYHLRRRVPGLVAGGRVAGRGYYLAIGTDAVARRIASEAAQCGQNLGRSGGHPQQEQ